MQHTVPVITQPSPMLTSTSTTKFLIHNMLNFYTLGFNGSQLPMCVLIKGGY